MSQRAQSAKVSPQKAQPFVLDQAAKKKACCRQIEPSELSEDVPIKRLNEKVRQLDAATAYLCTLLQHVAQGLFFVNTSGVIASYSHAAETILQHRAIDVLFSAYSDHFADDAFGFSMQDALKSGHVPLGALLVPYGAPPSQKILEVEGWYIARESEFLLPNSRAEDLDVTQGILLSCRDVTLRQAEQVQKERGSRLRELGEMVSAIAHEIRNPLGGIKGFASLLERDLAKEPHLQKMASYIVEGASHLSRLIDTMLSYARPLKLNVKPVDLVVFLLDFLYQVRIDPALAHVDYSMNFTEGSLHAKVDAGLLRAALLNLVTNAVQAMPNGGKITIGLYRLNERGIITVTDTGEGISKENLDKIFQPFFTTKEAGSGFGLSEALKIAQAHQGILEVKSEVGKGTCFSLYLPALPD